MQVADLHWEQLDQLHEVHLFASQVLDKPTADIDRSLEALQTRCVSHPQMIVPVTELRELVNLLRRSGDCFVDGSGGTSSVFFWS
jgi:hypothetical protein